MEMFVTSEYIYKNNKLNETRNIVENNLQEYELKYGLYCNRVLKVVCIAKFLDKIKNEMKKITIDR